MLLLWLQQQQLAGPSCACATVARQLRVTSQLLTTPAASATANSVQSAQVRRTCSSGATVSKPGLTRFCTEEMATHAWKDLAAADHNMADLGWMS
jgi:hypothetical protein